MLHIGVSLLHDGILAVIIGKSVIIKVFVLKPKKFVGLLLDFWKS